MKNYYSILGVPSPGFNRKELKPESEVLDENEKAYQLVLRKAYKLLILNNHSDKLGENHPSKEAADEYVKTINEAYSILKDLVQWKKYNAAWEIYHKCTPDQVDNTLPAGFITTTKSSYSATYKQQHKQLVEQFNQKPMKIGKNKKSFNNLNEDDLLSILAAIKNKKPSKAKMKSYEFTPINTILLLNDFLNAKYDISELNTLLNHLQVKIQRSKSSGYYVYELELLEGVYGIITTCIDANKGYSNLLKFFQKIANFAKAMSLTSKINEIFQALTLLFANNKFRSLNALALKYYWKSGEDILSDENLKLFDGYELALKKVDELKEKLSSDTSDAVVNLLKFTHTLSKLEKVIHHTPEAETDLAKYYRDKAYLILDWMPAIVYLAGNEGRINSFLLVGLYFQLAARFAASAEIGMADQTLAMRIYVLINSFSQNETPNLEMYVKIHILKCIAQFEYQQEGIELIIEPLINRTLYVANFYPFYAACQSNIQMINTKHEHIVLLRQYLHCLLKNYETNPKVIDIEYVRILTEIFKACVERWYETNTDIKIIELYRQKLMKEMLAVNSWTFKDVDKLLKPALTDTIMHADDNWLSPTRSLSFASRNEVYYTNIDSVELNFETGKINITAHQWMPNAPLHNKLFTWNSVIQILKNGISSTFLSLDPPDPMVDTHPYNNIRFKPTALIETHLFHTMLEADYFLLKFTTIATEVNCAAPYPMRKIDTALSILPPHLKKIFTDYHEAKQHGLITRFFIDSEELGIASNQTDKNLKKLRFVFGDMKMRLKKNSMKKDLDGKLIDIKDDNEGYDIYLISQSQRHNAFHEIKEIDRPAIIIMEKTCEFYIYNNKEISKSYFLDTKSYNNFGHYISRIKREANGKIIVENSVEEYRIYQLTKVMTSISGQSNRYSPEYIFVQEFTNSYNALAEFFPILGRLRELSKAVMMTRLLETQRENNQEVLDSLNKELSDANIQKVRTDIRNKIKPAIESDLAAFRKQLEAKNSEIINNLDCISKELGDFQLSPHSAEMDEIVNSIYEENKKSIIKSHGSQAWSYNANKIWREIQDQRASLAREISTKRYNHSLQQLKELFSNDLQAYDADIILSEFMNRPHNCRLIEILIAANRANQISQIGNKIFKSNSLKTIDDAISGHQYAINTIINTFTDESLTKFRNDILLQVTKHQKLENSFCELGLPKDQPEIDISTRCLWVPASINLDARCGHTTSYGGVQLAGRPNFLCNSNSAMNNGMLGGNGNNGGGHGNNGGGNGSGGNSRVERMIQVLNGYLGDGFSMKKNSLGDPIFMSADGNRKIRFDTHDPRGYAPHGHVEIKSGNKWTDYTGQHHIKLRTSHDLKNTPTK